MLALKSDYILNVYFFGVDSKKVYNGKQAAYALRISDGLFSKYAKSGQIPYKKKSNRMRIKGIDIIKFAQSFHPPKKIRSNQKTTG